MTLTWQTYVISDKPVHYPVVIFVFLSTWMAYVLQRFLKSESKIKFKSIRHFWLDHHKKDSIYIMIFCGLGIFMCINFLPLKLLWLIVPVGIVSFFYAGNFLTYFSLPYPNLRSIPVIKIFLIALSWTLMCGIMPLLLYEYDLKNVILISLFIGFYIFGLCIPFDIRDAIVDDISQKTLPTVLGKFTSKIISVICFLTTLFIGLYYLNLGIGLIIGVFVSIFLVAITHQNRKELFFTGIIDGSIVLFSLLNIFLN